MYDVFDIDPIEKNFLTSIQSIKFGKGSLDVNLIQNLKEKVHPLINIGEFRDYLSESFPEDFLLNFQFSIRSKSIGTIECDQIHKVFSFKKIKMTLT